MIGCTGSVGRGLYLHLILPAKCASQLRSRGRAASISNRGRFLNDFRSASDGTTRKLDGFQEPGALHITERIHTQKSLVDLADLRGANRPCGGVVDAPRGLARS